MEKTKRNGNWHMHISNRSETSVGEDEWTRLSRGKLNDVRCTAETADSEEGLVNTVSRTFEKAALENELQDFSHNLND